MPASLDTERSILGAILLDNDVLPQAAESLRAEDFSLDSHRRIYMRMLELNETSRPIDIITLTEELSRKKEVEAVGGVAYLSSLTEGLPRRENIEHYVKIVKDKALLRGLIHAAQSAISHALDQSDTTEEIIDAAESAIFKISESRIGRGFLGIGAAWFEREHHAFGVPFPPLKERFERLEETLQIAHQAWAGDATPFHGKYYQLAERPTSSRRPVPKA